MVDSLTLYDISFPRGHLCIRPDAVISLHLEIREVDPSLRAYLIRKYDIIVGLDVVGDWLLLIGVDD